MTVSLKDHLNSFHTLSPAMMAVRNMLVRTSCRFGECDSRMVYRLHHPLYGTQPVIYHAPGGVGTLNRNTLFWRQFVSFVMKNNRPVVQTRGDYEIITLNNSPDISDFEKSMDALGLEYSVLGRDILIWHGIFKDRNWNDFISMKPQVILAHLKASRAKYVICSDAFDAVMVGNPDGIVDALDELKCRMLFNASPDSGNNPSPHWPTKEEVPAMAEVERFEKGFNTPLCALNAGVWVAEREYAIHFISTVIAGPFFDGEQAGYRYIYPNEYPNTQVDMFCSVFQAVHGEDNSICEPRSRHVILKPAT